MFPEGLENRLRVIDDFIIQHVQLLLNSVTMVLAKWISGKDYRTHVIIGYVWVWFNGGWVWVWYIVNYSVAIKGVCPLKGCVQAT